MPSGSSATTELLRLRYDSGDFRRLTEELDVYKEDIKSALDSAAKDTTAIINEDLGKEMATVTGLSARLIRGRIAMRFRYADHTGTVWIGLNPFPLKRLRPRQTRRGVTAGTVRIDSAFIVGSRGGHVFVRSGAARLPIEKQFFAIEEQGRLVIDRLSARLEELFLRVLDVKLRGIKGRVNRRNIDTL